MNTESLKIFCSVASELSITRAANRLGRVPSNVTTRIQQLETEMGTDLFVRINKRLSLSSAGERFFDYAKRLIALEEEAKQMVSGTQSGGSLHIGSMESTAASRLPIFLADFSKRYPSTQLTLKTAPSRPLMDEVQKGLLDCAFVALSSTQVNSNELDERELNFLPVWQEDLVLLLPSIDSEVRHVSELKTRTLAAFVQGCTYRTLAEQILDITGDTDWNVLEFTSYHTMIACVAAGHCVTLLPKSVLALSPAANTLSSLFCESLTTYLVWRKGYQTPAILNLTGAIKEYC